jgi:hypothetical protein
MRAKTVIFYNAAPIRIDHFRAFRTGAYAVFPMVLIGKAASGPAQIWDFDLFKRCNNILPYAPDIGNGRIFANPVAAVNTASQMLGKMAVNMAAYPHIALYCINNDSVHELASKKI